MTVVIFSELLAPQIALLQSFLALIGPEVPLSKGDLKPEAEISQHAEGGITMKVIKTTVFWKRHRKLLLLLNSGEERVCDLCRKALPLPGSLHEQNFLDV